MIEKKIYKCQWCHEEHESDSTGWIQTCKGYFPVFVMRLTEEELNKLQELRLV